VGINEIVIIVTLSQARNLHDDDDLIDPHVLSLPLHSNRTNNN